MSISDLFYFTVTTDMCFSLISIMIVQVYLVQNVRHFNRNSAEGSYSVQAAEVRLNRM